MNRLATYTGFADCYYLQSLRAPHDRHLGGAGHRTRYLVVGSERTAEFAEFKESYTERAP